MMVRVVDCEICDVLESDQPVVFTTKHWSVALSPDQGYLGRAYVTLIDHRESLSALSIEEWDDLRAAIQSYEQALRELFGAELFNWGCLLNNAYKVAEPKPHVHWHVRPRYKQPVTVDGTEYIDPNFAHHYDRKNVKMVDGVTLSTLSDKVREVIHAG